MSRRLLFWFVTGAAVILAACGKQVTPNPPGIGAGGALPGYMTVKFDVAAPFDPSTYQYWVVFNTSGNGLTPSTFPFRDNWASFSDGVEISGNAGGTGARAFQFIKNSNPAIQPAFQPLITAPQQLQYVANSNGSGTEFSVTFQRSIFRPVNVSPGPSPTASPPFASNWLFNGFVTQANQQNQLIFVDSMGVGGPVDPQYNSPVLNINQCFDNVNYALFTGTQIPEAAQIVSIEIGNNPSPGPSSHPC